MADYDSPWKDALDEYFEAFIGLFFSAMHVEIDWSRKYESLDKELQRVAPKSEEGRRIVDKLVKVWRKSGEEEWVAIHVEVQGQEEGDFAHRMFVYNSRIAEHHKKPVVSVAILADENPSWRPTSFHRELWGCANHFSFPSVKLLDFAAKSDELEQSDNPFAIFVLAHLKALETRRDGKTRYYWKLRLIRGVYERGQTAKKVRRIFRLIDWVMELPLELARQFRDELHAIQEEKRMPYVTSIERLAMEEGFEKGREEGREEGLKQGIHAILKARFGAEGVRLMSEIDAIHEDGLLEAILVQAGLVASPNELRECWK